MKRLLSLFVLLTTMVWSTWADETITVTANSEDISQALDLKAVATLFGTVKNVEEFETLLNNPDSAFTNLDLNGDGLVDYLRVVETSADNKHLVVIQAVLAKDVFQDVASIYVEKDEVTGEVTTQVIGDEYVYGANYVIEPVYIYRPYIYDWFWDPFWVCWTSPFYWDFYPHWWHHWHCWTMDRYWHHCYHWHHYHPYCSFRYASSPRPAYQNMRHTVARHEYARAHHDRSFASRNAGHTNARTINAQRAASSRSFSGGAAPSRQGSVAATRVGAAPAASRRTGDNTFGSTAVRRNAYASSTRQAASAQRGSAPVQRSGQSMQRPTSASVQRSSTSAPARSGQTVQRSTSVASSSRSTAPSRSTATTTRSSSSTTHSTATTTRSTAPSRSSSSASSYSGSRSSSSSSTRSSAPARSSSSSSYGGSRSSSSSSYGGSRSSGSSSSSRSSGGYSGGSHSSGGGYSGGHSGGGHSGGGGGRSGGGSSTRR